MELREQMFEEVLLWKSSGKKRADFVKEKEYTLSKFTYWVGKYYESNKKSSCERFTEIPIKEEFILPPSPLEKAMEIETSTGITITIYK